MRDDSRKGVLALAVSGAVLASAIAAGCFGGPAAGAPDAGNAADARREAIERATRALAVKVCDGIQRCASQSFTSYPDMETCVVRWVTFFERGKFGEGSTPSPAEVEACAAAVDFTSCETFYRYAFEGVRPEPCMALLRGGTLPNGSRCYDANQCEGACAPLGDGCGTCASYVPAGGSCSFPTQCDPTQGCWGGVCVHIVDRGELCGPGLALCHYTDWCDGTTCRARGGMGAPCDPSFPDGTCALFPEELTCDATGHCGHYALPAVGEPCDDHGRCGSGAKCKLDTPSGTCRPAVADGEPCGPGWASSDMCLPLAYCFQGVCQIVDSTSCTLPAPPP